MEGGIAWKHCHCRTRLRYGSRRLEDFEFHAGLVLARSEALLIDPGLLPDEIDALSHRIPTSEDFASRVVLTHGHWDHVLGPERMISVPTIAHEDFPTGDADPRRERIVTQVARRSNDQALTRSGNFAVPLPDETFSSARELSIGGIPIWLLHTPGHSPDHAVVYLKEEGLLWSADMLSEAEIPYVCQSLVEYERTLERLSQLPVRTLIPTHGFLTRDKTEIRRRFDTDRTYLGELHRRVTQAISESRSVDETVELCADMTFPNRDQNKRPHRMNVEHAYCEFGGEGDPACLGWNRLYVSNDAG